MTQAEQLVFNPFDPAFRTNPYPTYHRLLHEDPIHQGPFETLVFSRYADCVSILRDARSSSDARNSAAFQQEGNDALVDTTEEQVLGVQPFLFLDPPDHTRLRGLVSKAFTPRVVEALRPRVQEIVDELLGRVRRRDQIEVIEDLAYPLPVQVICEMLGVPAEDHVTFRAWSRELARSLDPEDVLPPEVQERRRRTIESFADYFRSLIERRREDPREDLLSCLIAVEEEGDKLSPEELLSTCILILVAGHETTVNLIGNGLLALLRHPDQLHLLRLDPSLAKTAVEEVLRFDPPVQMTGRTALEDMEVGGATIRRGQQSILLLAAANRDPSVFAKPDEFDIGRRDNPHLAFGFGIHYCLGAPLARIEGEVALTTLVRRFQGLQLRVERPEYKENIVLRGLAALPVTFERAI
jgi:cytochrome P450